MSQTVEEFAALDEELQRALLAELLGGDVQIAPDADLAKMYEDHLAAVASDAGDSGAASGKDQQAAAKPAAKQSAAKAQVKPPLKFKETVRFMDGDKSFFMKKGDELPAGDVSAKVAKALKADGHIE